MPGSVHRARHGTARLVYLPPGARKSSMGTPSLDSRAPGPGQPKSKSKNKREREREGKRGGKLGRPQGRQHILRQSK